MATGDPKATYDGVSLRICYCGLCASCDTLTIQAARPDREYGESLRPDEHKTRHPGPDRVEVAGEQRCNSVCGICVCTKPKGHDGMHRSQNGEHGVEWPGGEMFVPTPTEVEALRAELTTLRASLAQLQGERLVVTDVDWLEREIRDLDNRLVALRRHVEHGHPSAGALKTLESHIEQAVGLASHLRTALERQ